MLSLILLILALVCFIWAAAGSPGAPGGIGVGWLGLAFWVLTQLISRGGG